VLKLLLHGLIRSYQLLVSPLLPAACRYLPTCSEYAQEAIERHGVLAGSWLALCRLARCHPWGGSGYDPVPPPADRAGGASCRHPH
jgi:uncharacterized protein